MKTELITNVSHDLKTPTCSLEALKPYHLPINRISARDKVSKKSGMSVLDSEIKFKTFAIDISDDAEMIESLIQRMF